MTTRPNDLRGRRVLSAILIAGAAALGVASAAQAAVVTTRSFADGSNDPFGTVDVYNATASNLDGVTLDIAAGVFGATKDGNSIALYIDTDNDPATGSPLFDGAEVYMSSSVRGSYPNSTFPTAFGRWNGSRFDLNVPRPASVTIDPYGLGMHFRVAMADLGVPPNGTVSFEFLGHDGPTGGYDHAPDQGAWSFKVGQLPPSGPPPGALDPPAEPVADPASPVAVASQPLPAPLGIRSFSFHKAGKGVRLQTAWTGGAGRVTWTLTLSAKDPQGHRFTRTVTGAKGPDQSVNRLLGLPSRVHGSPLSAVLRVRDGGTSLTRSVSIRV